MKHVMRFAFQIAMAVAGTILMNAHPAVSQDIRSGGGREGQPDRSDIILTRSAGKSISGRDAELVAVQIHGDFNEIQVIKKQLAEKILSGDTLELSFVADATSKIRRRAERLLDNLRLPQSNSRESFKVESVTNAAQLKRSLNSLVALVVEFTRSPIFGVPRSTNTDHMRQARHDLEDIISLSNYLRKRSVALQ